MTRKSLQEEILEAFLIALDEGKRGDRKRLRKRMQRDVDRNTVTDGDNKVFGTEHFKPDDKGHTKRYKKRYNHEIRKKVGKFLKDQKRKGKEVDFGVEGGSHESPKKGFEKSIALGTTKGGKRKGVKLQSNELGGLTKVRKPGPEIGPRQPLMKDDADRTEAEKKRAFPRDYGDPQNPESKKVDQVNRLRQKGFKRFARQADKSGRGSVQLVGSGHINPDTAPGHRGTPGVRDLMKR